MLKTTQHKTTQRSRTFITFPFFIIPESNHCITCTLSCLLSHVRTDAVQQPRALPSQRLRTANATTPIEQRVQRGRRTNDWRGVLIVPTLPIRFNWRHFLTLHSSYWLLFILLHLKPSILSLVRPFLSPTVVIYSMISTFRRLLLP